MKASNKSLLIKRLRHKIKTVHTLSKLGTRKKKSLPPNWISTVDTHTKRTFFYNSVTGESSWIRPRESTKGSSGDGPSAPQGPLRAAVLVVNVQADFFHRGSMPVPGAEKILPGIQELCGMENVSVFHIKLQRPANHASFFCNNPGAIFQDQINGIEMEMYVTPSHCVEGTPGAAIHNALLPLNDDAVVIDVGGSPLIDDFSPFASIDDHVPLETLLRENDIGKIFVVGIGLETAIQAVALDAQLYSDADVFVVIDAVAELGDRWSFPAAADQAQKRLQSANIGIIDIQNATDLIRDANLQVATRNQSRSEGSHDATATTMRSATTTTTRQSAFSNQDRLLPSEQSEIAEESVRKNATRLQPGTGRSKVHEAILRFDLGTTMCIKFVEEQTCPVCMTNSTGYLAWSCRFFFHCASVLFGQFTWRLLLIEELTS